MKSGRTIRTRFARAIAEALEPRQLLSGTEYLVNSLDDTVAADNVVTLREAIQAANTNAAVNDAPAGSATETDIIRFDPVLFASGPGTIRLSGTELRITGPVAILGPGQDQLTLDADGKSRVLSSIASDLTLDGMTITGGVAGSYQDGGGILNSGAALFRNLLISGNVARWGGGFANGSSQPVSLINVTVAQNQATRGGGISNSGSLFVSGGNIRNNTATGRDTYQDGGGGIYNMSPSGLGLTLNGTSLVGNSAAANGGGLYLAGGMSTLDNVTISGNSAFNTGGGVTGAAIAGACTLTNVTIVNNFVNNGTGGVDLGSSTVIYNSIIARNRGAYDRPDISGTPLAGSDYNLIGASGPLLGSHNHYGTPSSPLDPKLGELAEINGTLVHPLLAGSPAINAGGNAFAGSLPTDQVGNPRIVDTIVDIGAVEGTMDARPAVTYVVTSLADDVAADGTLTLREALEAANFNKPVGDAPAGSFTERDRITFAPGLSGAINASANAILIQSSLSIEGPGAGQLLFSGDGKSCVIRIAPTGDAWISGVRISGGAGGISNEGKLLLTDATVSDNTTVNTPGGGIYNIGALTLVNVSVCGNSASSSTMQVSGGGIYSSTGASLTIINTTISGNSANTSGGGIDTRSATFITNSTISGNTAGPNSGGLMIEPGAAVVMNNTIIAGNRALLPAFNDLYGVLRTPSDYNFIGVLDPSQGGPLGTHSLIGRPTTPLDPKLGPLTQINGRFVYPLLPGSPALNAGSNALAVDADGNPLATDGAGQARIAGGTVDIGAFEYQPQALAISGTEGKDAIELSGDDASYSYRINAGAVMKMPRSLVSALRIDASGGDELSFDVDLQASDLLIQSDAGSRDQLLASVFQAIGSGKIRTSSGDELHGLGAILNQDAQAKRLYESFAGQSVDENSILVKLTWNGDADLNGMLDGSDYFFIDKAYLSRNSANPPTGYGNGDFNYDGTIDGSDYFLIDKAFLSQGSTPAAAAPMSAVAGPSGRVKRVVKGIGRRVWMRVKGHGQDAHAR